MFCLFSCSKIKKENNEFRNFLVGNDKYVWSLWAIESDKYIFLGNHNIFFNNNTYEYYIAGSDKELGGAYNNHIKEKDLRIWSFSPKDSVLSLNNKDPNFSYKLIKYVKDTIWMKGYGYRGEFALIKIHVDIPKE